MVYYNQHKERTMENNSKRPAQTDQEAQELERIKQKRLDLDRQKKDLKKRKDKIIWIKLNRTPQEIMDKLKRERQ